MPEGKLINISRDRIAVLPDQDDLILFFSIECIDGNAVRCVFSGVHFQPVRLFGAGSHVVFFLFAGLGDGIQCKVIQKPVMRVLGDLLDSVHVFLLA